MFLRDPFLTNTPRIFTSCSSNSKNIHFLFLATLNYKNIPGSSNAKLQEVYMDPSERRAARLRRRRERSRERRAAESSEQREARLAIRKETDRARRQQRLASESAEEREARLQQMRLRRQRRLASESSEEREARLQHQQRRLASESSARTRLSACAGYAYSYAPAQMTERTYVRTTYIYPENRYCLALIARQ